MPRHRHRPAIPQALRGLSPARRHLGNDCSPGALSHSEQRSEGRGEAPNCGQPAPSTAYPARNARSGTADRREQEDCGQVPQAPAHLREKLSKIPTRRIPQVNLGTMTSAPALVIDDYAQLPANDVSSGADLRRLGEPANCSGYPILERALNGQLNGAVVAAGAMTP